MAFPSPQEAAERPRTSGFNAVGGTRRAGPLPSVAIRLSAARFAIARRVGRLALAMCGVSTTFGTSSRPGWTPARPRTHRARRRRCAVRAAPAASAASSTRPPRAMFVSVAVGFISANSAAPISVVRRRAVRHDDHEVVRLAQQHGLRRPARTELRLDGGVQPRCGCDRPPACEAKRAAPRDRLADAAHAEDAEGRAMHVGAGEHVVAPSAPFAAPQEMFALADAPRRGHHQSEAEVGRGLGQHAGRIADQHAARGAGGDVDVVVADGHAADGRSSGQAASSAASIGSVPVTKHAGLALQAVESARRASRARRPRWSRPRSAGAGACRTSSNTARATGTWV